MKKRRFPKSFQKIICLPESELPPQKEDFRKSFQWKIFRIMAEFVDGFQFIAGFKKSVAIFGSTHFSQKNPCYQEARKLARLLAKVRFAVFTGRGSGIMEAANRGVSEAGGQSIGINIQLPEGQVMNEYVTHSIGFNYFFTRKVMLALACYGYVFFPGGLGILDEFFGIITLIQIKKLSQPIAVVAIGKEYWKPLFYLIFNEVFKKRKAVKKEDLQIFQIVDSAEEAFTIRKKVLLSKS